MGCSLPNRGAALLTVLVAIMVISIMLFEFQYASQVEQKLAHNELNQLQAYYLAKSGVRFGLLRVVLFARANKDPAINRLASQNPQVASFINAIWSMPLPAFPPNQSKIDQLTASDRQSAENLLKQTKITDGKSTHVISDESSKINLNDLMVPTAMRDQRIDFRADTPQGHFWYTGRLLINLIENFIRESENAAEEYGDLRPEELVYDIMDWVTPGDTRFQGSDKDAFYEKQLPPYKAKRNRFYTLNELRLVRGVNERLYNKLRPLVTVYADQGKININTTSREDFYRALLPSIRPDDVKKILEERDRRGGWSSESEFAEFIKSTFGGADFDKLYPNKNEYPFAVTSQSFMIEAMGQLDRNKSAIQKIIRVGATLQAIGTDCGSLDAAKCKGPCFLDPRGGAQVCRAKPKTQEECSAIVSSQFYEENGKQCCKITLDGGVIKPVCYDPKSDAPKDPVAPNAVKIVYWSEA